MASTTAKGVFAPIPHKFTTVVSTNEVPTPLHSTPPVAPRTISELVSVRAKSTPWQPILGYPIEGIDYVEYTYRQLDDFATAGARLLAPQSKLRKDSNAPESIVAILGPSSLDYFVTVLALSRLGFTVLFLSTRISNAAYVSLLEATNCRDIYVDPTFRDTASTVQASLKALQIHDVLVAADYQTRAAEITLPLLDLDEETNRISWIIHSSGSTGLPKPIYQTHAAALRNYENNMGLQGFITLPLFHAHGLSSVFRAITSGKKIWMYNAHLPLTSHYLQSIMDKCQFEIFYGVPYALKLLSESERGISTLAKLQVVMFGGSACPDNLGDLLATSGVNLISHYGTTETGQLMTSARPAGDTAWNFVRVDEKLAPFAAFEDRGGNLFELVVLDGWPSKVATNRENGAYATKDLFEPHPSISGAWKFAGRLDDTIVLLNGEKAIPIPMEMAIRSNPLVKDAVMFGNGKPSLGLIVIASEAARSMTSDALVEQLLPTVEEQNLEAPAYAQLSREMINVLSPDTNYAQTDKGTLIRQAFYRTFREHIEGIYQKLEASATGKMVLSDVDLRCWLHEQILLLAPGIAAADLHDDTDLFSIGVDSLQSSRLRATILRHIQLNQHTLPQNIVFEQPNIVKLANSLISIRDGASPEATNVEKDMQMLIEKYSVFPDHLPVRKDPLRRIVVVTGATGSLGAHVVATLVKRDDVSEVCCLVRAPNQRLARQRVIRSMNERAVLHDLSLNAQRKITAYPSDLADARLGLDESTYTYLQNGIVNLIHCAWSVNFNKTLASFEKDCIAGTRNLMLLCLSAQSPRPASFNFCSSVSTVARTTGGLVPEALPQSLSYAQGMGYAQSKLVTENIVNNAALRTNMVARVLRVGQIVADQTRGIWNDTEAIPLMLQAATTISALPTLEESPRWLPVNVVAHCVADISTCTDTNVFYNLVNPKSFHWSRDLLPALERAGLSFDKVSQRQWIQRLRASDPNVEANPTFKLLEFFANKYDHDRPAQAGLEYATARVTEASPTLSSCPALTQDLVTKFVKQFLNTSWSSRNLTRPLTRLVVLSGPCGSGKSTVAQLLAQRLSCPYLEGDSLHDAIAITKMSNGIPLNEIDREIWLARVRLTILEKLRDAQLLGLQNQSSTPRYIVLTCSALGSRHRNALRSILSDGTLVTQFIMLAADEDELRKRVRARAGHYMKEEMVKSQLESLEWPQATERDVLPLDSQLTKQADIVDEICEILDYKV